MYFFPEPQGHGLFLPTLGLVRRGSLVWAGWCIGDFYRFLGCCVYDVAPTLKFSDPMGPPQVNKRCVPYIVPEVFHPNLNLTVERSDYGDFLV